MAHGVPLAIGEDNYGAEGAFFLDAGISSTHHIASFWCLGGDLVEMPRSTGMVSEPFPIRADGRAVVLARKEAGGTDSDETSIDPSERQDARRPYDPNLVIAAAFKLAGLPVPKLPS